MHSPFLRESSRSGSTSDRDGNEKIDLAPAFVVAVNGDIGALFAVDIDFNFVDEDGACCKDGGRQQWIYKNQSDAKACLTFYRLFTVLRMVPTI